MATVDDLELVAIGETARILRCSQELARRLADRGELHALRLSNGYRVFRRTDVEVLARLRAERRGASAESCDRTASRM
jgi:DNA-binding transcriptional MerR regulator